MNREEEITEGANYWVDMVDEIEFLKPHPTWQDLRTAFKAGAKWADEHPLPPSEDYIKKLMHLEVERKKLGGWPIDTIAIVKYIQEHWNDENT